MKVDENIVSRQVREAVVDQLQDLATHVLQQMERDAVNGWRHMYSFPLWIKENTSPPHLNSLGMRYLIGELTMDLFIDPDTGISTRPNPMIELFKSNRDSRVGYRSLLYPGMPDLMAFSGKGDVLDEVVNDTANRLLAEQDRHVLYEVEHSCTHSYLDALMSKGTLTAPPALWQNDPVPPVRDPALSIERDAAYWRAKYHLPTTMVYDMLANQHVQTKPEATLGLMQELAPDFSFSPALSTASRLVFVDHGAGALAWAVMIEKVDKAREYTYPPKLALIVRAMKKKFQNKHSLFTHVDIIGGRQTPLWPREVEINILFHMQRLRGLINFYQPIVDKVLAESRP